MNFKTKLSKICLKNDSLLCVGLDPDMQKIPAFIAKEANPLFEFNKAIIDATADSVCAFKPNSAMYEALGADGIRQLQETCHYISKSYPEVPIILDYKRADIGNTNSYYASFAFDYLKVDSITINPYMGKEANQAFLDYEAKGIIVLCRTSNPGAGEFQDLMIGNKKLYRIVAENVMNNWNDHNNCSLVIGSPYPDELSEIRRSLGDDVLFLVPGVGTQGGSIELTVRAGINSKGSGMLVNSSREVIYAANDKDFAQAAREKALAIKEEINKYRR